MNIILFGNRGSRPLGASADSPFERYGGDTTAIGILCGRDNLIAIDTGSGFWKWPYTLKTILNNPGPYNLKIFYSHYHDDHTMGIAQSPFLFEKANQIAFHGPDRGTNVEQIFNARANCPLNPDLSKVYKAQMTFNSLASAELPRTMDLADGAKISWLTVPHGMEFSNAYRIDHAGQSVCCVGDLHHEIDEAGEPVLDPRVIDFIRDADAMIYDAHFSDAELIKMPFLRSFGHSTGEHGVRLAQAAGVPLLVSHHHDPNKTDADLDLQTAMLQKLGRAHGVAVIAAQPSLCIDLALPNAERLPFIEKQATPAERRVAIAVANFHPR